MKVVRSSKCFYDKWITKKKHEEIKMLLQEYSRVCNYFVETYEGRISKDIPKHAKKGGDGITYEEYMPKCKEDTKTFLSSGMIVSAFSEAFGAVLSAKSNAENRKDKKYFRPKFYGKKMNITLNTCIDHRNAEKTKLFDYNCTIKGIYDITLDKSKRGYKLSIPLKRHVQFNKWANVGKISTTVELTDKYVKFAFEVNTDKKKEVGVKLGIDFGLKNLGTLSNGQVIGPDIEKLLNELVLKKRCSKAYYRKKEEIRSYINEEIKKIDFENTQLIVMENLKGLKYKMKEAGRLPKKIRSVFYNLSYRQFLDRIQMYCEDNRVRYQCISPFNSSRQCLVCGHIEKSNRLDQEHFVCQNCGHSDNADANASKVLLKRVLTGTCGSCCETNSDNLKSTEQLQKYREYYKKWATVTEEDIQNISCG